MKLKKTKIPGLLIIEPDVFYDSRGFFLETWQEKRYLEVGIQDPFVQDNFSHSTHGILRGLHYQLRHPQGKLVWVSAGEVFDVAVDIRINSPTFGEWFGIILSSENHLQIYVPPGFAHGFCVLSETADFNYKCTESYVPGDEYGLKWNDPRLGIHWPVADPILSEKDATLPGLDTVPRENLPGIEGI